LLINEITWFNSVWKRERITYTPTLDICTDVFLGIERPHRHLQRNCMSKKAIEVPEHVKSDVEHARLQDVLQNK
jgi:hypothetical protein